MEKQGGGREGRKEKEKKGGEDRWEEKREEEGKGGEERRGKGRGGSSVSELLVIQM